MKISANHLKRYKEIALLLWKYGRLQDKEVQTSFRIFGYPGLAILCFLAAVAGGFSLVFSIFVQDNEGRKK